MSLPFRIQHSAFILVSSLLLSSALAQETAAPAAGGKPAAPLGVAMTANTPDSITLGWYRSPNNEATGYNVYSSDEAEGTYTRIATVTERSATHTGLAPGKNVFYKVSATTANGESEKSSPATPAFTIAPWEPKPFPVKIAKNMCVSLNSDIVCNTKPLTGKPANLVDGSDATSCRFRKECEIKIKLDPAISIADSAYLLLHFRVDGGSVDWSNDKQARTFRAYTVIESADSTDGKDGTWTEVLSGTNELLDGVFVFPNHKPKWVGIRSTYAPGEERPAATDTRLMPRDLILCRLDVFRAAPEGQRNDYWIFTGDSLVVQDMPGGTFPGRSALFSDLIRQQHPDRYPIVVHAARGGEMLKDTLPRTERVLADLSPANGTSTPTATMVCWEAGYNDVGVGGSLGLGGSMIKSYETAQKMCESKGLILIPVRIEFSTQYLNKETLEPMKYNIFVNSQAVNLGGVDVFARTSAPYAVDPKTGLPYADYWNYTRTNYATALVADGVHHTQEGADGINKLWADVADKMIYTPQK